MKKLLFGLIAAALFAGTGLAAEPAAIDVEVNANTVVNQIDEKVYSHFLEHIYNSCNGGLWGELVWNRSFEAGRFNVWSCENGTYVQKEQRGNPRLTIGAADWTDYELTCKAKKIAGQEGFLILFRANSEEYYWVNLGGWKNERNGLERGRIENGSDRRRGVAADFVPFSPIKTGKTYDIRLRVEGNRFQLFMDGQKIMDCRDENAIPVGAPGLGTWDTAAEYSNVVVKTLDGTVLFDGVKDAAKSLQKPDIRFWNLEGAASMGALDARNSKYYVRFLDKSTLSQKPFAFKTDETYDFSYWTRGKGNLTFQNFKQSVDSDKWVKITGSFKVDESTNEGQIQFAVQPNAGQTVDLDQVSIMPRSWKENYDGFRPDLLEAIKAIRPTLIRWPGGCYASAYRWKDGIGPQDDRGSYPIELWNDVDVNSFGIDEFVSMCRKVGAEPDMVVDIGTKQWRFASGGEEAKIDWLTEVCDWVEYCNGPADSKWGAVRAKNGHPEPYHIKYWEIDNEVHPDQTPSAEYVETLKTLIPRMKAIDPTITIIACGSWCGNRDAWDQAVIDGAGDLFSFLSTHQYDNPNGYAVNPYNNRRFFEKRAEFIANSPNKNVRVFDSEWNAQSTDWRTGLHAGGILNCFEQAGETLHIAAPALFLRHTSATGWDNAFVNFDHTGWFPAPNYVVMKLWRDHYAPKRVELTSDSAELNGENPIVNAVATRSEDGKTVYVKVVNNQMADSVLKLKINGVDVKSAQAQTVTPELQNGEQAKEKLSKRNTLDAPAAIAPKDNPVSTSNSGLLEITLPSLSATVITVDVSNRK